jgi:hypothetical protein
MTSGGKKYSSGPNSWNLFCHIKDFHPKKTDKPSLEINTFFFFAFTL